MLLISVNYQILSQLLMFTIIGTDSGPHQTELLTPATNPIHLHTTQRRPFLHSNYHA